MSATVGEIATIAHGYTMAQLDEIANTAANYSLIRGGRLLDRDDRYEAAWHAAVESLYSSDEKPTRWNLVDAGLAAIVAAVNDDLSNHGWNRNAGPNEHGANFNKYWLHITADPADFTDNIVERMALPQILGELTDLEYEAISTMAIMGNQQAAADALRIPLQLFNKRLGHARRRAQAAWFAPEAPVARRRGDDRSCRYGHDRSENGYRTNAGIWACRVCARNASRRRRARN